MYWLYTTFCSFSIIFNDAASIWILLQLETKILNQVAHVSVLLCDFIKRLHIKLFLYSLEKEQKFAVILLI